MIPKILHRTIPASIAVVYESFWLQWWTMHPGWSCRTWREPLDPAEWETGDKWAECRSGAQKAGLIRLELLWKYGGVYVDMDMQPLRPLDDLRVHPCFIGTEDGIWLTDAMIGAEPQHPGIRACLDAALDVDMTQPANVTGPRLVTDVLHGRRDVSVFAARMFYPYLYTEPARRNEDFATTSPESYAVHHWEGSWL